MRELELRTKVDREVIRIMLREGLLPEPRRPSRNAADYSEAHVSGILAIRRLQQSTRLTFREIKTAMAGLGSSPAAAYPNLEELLAHRFGLDNVQSTSLLTMEARYPHAERDARAFGRLGMLSIIEGKFGPSLTLTDARLVEIWGLIREAGFIEEGGFLPENIAFYRDAAETVAKNEAMIFFEKAGEKIDKESSASMLHVALPLMLDFFGLLRMKAFMKHVHSYMAQGQPGPSQK